MGIEPFLLILILVGMFFLQAARALHEALMDRLEFSLETGREVKALALRTHMRRGKGGNRWRCGRTQGDAEMLFDSFPALRIRGVMADATGVRHNVVNQHLPWLSPSVLVVVRLPGPIVQRGTTLQISPLRSVIPDSQRMRLHQVVLDQVVRIRTNAPDEVRELLADPKMHELLIELMAIHPLSVVTEQVIALWCTRPLADPEPLVTLATEIAIALRTSAQLRRPEAHRAG